MVAEIKVIRSDEQHQQFLNEIHRLMCINPSSDDYDGEKLELLSVLVDSYENSKYPIEPPDPIEAILFRMEEQGLKQADLIPYFGTRSRVSEVLARKRPLTVNMIRAISAGLGISAETLVGANAVEPTVSDRNEIDWSKFPLKEMLSRGWIQNISDRTSKTAEDLVRSFIGSAGLNFGLTNYRRTIGGEAYSPSTKYSLYAWLARVTQRAREKRKNLGVFDRNNLSAAFLRELSQLSWFEHGPVLAVEFLEKYGVAVIVEPALKGTLLDGAAFQDEDGTPIIGITLRFDRIDNFWFTLVHEVVHIWKHVDNSEAFLDNLDSTSEDKREMEANRVAKEALIPRVAWKRSDAYLNPNNANIDKLSRELKIHPGIIAGKIRREKENYMIFGDLVGLGEVRKLFNFSEQEA